MAITTIYTYPLNGTQRDFTIPFEYLARRFVVLTLIGTDRKELVLTTDYRFTSKTNVQTNVPWGPADGYERIEIRRNTSATDRLVDFADGSILRASELNTSQVQTLHVAEEARNMVADTISTNQDGDLDARGRRLVNLADAVGPDHAVTLRQEQAWAQSTLGNRNAAEAAAVLSVASKEAAQSAQGVSTAQATLSTTKAAESEASAVRSETAAGTIGDNVARAQEARTGAESARDQANVARDQANVARDQANVAAATLNFPPTAGASGKVPRVKAAGDGFEYFSAPTKAEHDELLGLINALTAKVSGWDSGWIDLAATHGRYARTHGLGVKPNSVRAWIKCKSPQGGFSIGDEISLSASFDYAGTSSGYGIQIDSTTPTGYSLSVGSVGALAAALITKDLSAIFTPTTANWQLRLLFNAF